MPTLAAEAVFTYQGAQITLQCEGVDALRTALASFGIGDKVEGTPTVKLAAVTTTASPAPAPSAPAASTSAPAADTAATDPVALRSQVSKAMVALATKNVEKAREILASFAVRAAKELKDDQLAACKRLIDEASA